MSISIWSFSSSRNSGLGIGYLPFRERFPSMALIPVAALSHLRPSTRLRELLFRNTTAAGRFPSGRILVSAIPSLYCSSRYAATTWASASLMPVIGIAVCGSIEAGLISHLTRLARPFGSLPAI